MKRAALLVLVLLVACESTRGPRQVSVPEISRISLLEDARNPAFPPAFLSSPSSAVRERAAVALGRIMDPQAIPALRMLAADPDLTVRKAAIFAMGQLGLGPEPLGEPDLEPLLKSVMDGVKHPDESIRATAVEAMGKLALQEAPLAAVGLLGDPSALVRRQAATACFRWRRVLRMRDPEAKLADLPKEVVAALCGASEDSDAEVRWRSIHALVQCAAAPTPEGLSRFLADTEPLSRLFALMSVERRKLKAAAESAAALQADPDPAVRQGAVRALRSVERPDLVKTDIFKDPSHHVREAVADHIVAEGPALEALEKDPYVAVRSAALFARLRISGEAGVEHLKRAMTDSDPLIRMAAVTGAASLKEQGRELLLNAAGDTAESVRAAALLALADDESSKAWLAIWRALTAPDVGERGSAAEALKKRKEPEVVKAAIECYRNSDGRTWVEVREMIVDLLASRPPDQTTPFLLDVAKNDQATSVRRRAAAALKRRGVTDVPERSGESPTRSPYFDRRFNYNPVVILETTKGPIEIECYGREAPVHVANFVGLVEKGFYDGLSWHRVVPNFVIQGGDPQGNGWGDAGWSLRAEVNPVPFRRGTLAMPRSAGFDTGGCQIFITHLPTPHLDGYYTVFGQVTLGLDVVDRIEIGDKITRATLKR